MKILLKTVVLFLLTTTILFAQESNTPNDNFILVNDAGCANCTIERSKSSMMEIRVFISKNHGDLKSYKVKIPGQTTIQVNGSKSNSAYKKAISLAKYGSKIQIFDLKTTNGILKSTIIIKLTR
ncbi:hypothetical protein [Pseudofulvibacter geojedonensis]|uniref:Gliding motility-associated protein GldM C-terminal domain-containing protein n=1 Tax=Pseudofulvibacter geojedonensis TaxID=1123758 RepID=A0ABW3I3C4_9FLAO